MSTNQVAKRTRFFVSAAPVARDADMSTVTDWTEVADLSGIDGDLGDESELISYEVWGADNRVRKLKGTRNAGDVTVKVARLADDPGQTLMRVAEQASEPFGFKCQLENGDTFLFPALCMSAKRSSGDNVVMLAYPLQLTDDVTEVAAV